MAKMFLGKYFPPSMVTKLRNEITNFRQRPDESLLEAWERYKLSIDRCPNHNMLPVTQIDTFYNGLTLRHCEIINDAAGGTFMKRRPEECYDLIKNLTARHNDWDTSAQRNESSSSYTSSSDQEVVALKAEMAEINKNLMKPPLAKPRTYMLWEPIKVVILTNLKNMQTNMKMNTASSSGSGTLRSNIVTNPKEDLMGITTRSGNAYQGPTIPTSSSLPKVMERETEVTKDMMPPTNSRSTKDVQPSVVQIETLSLLLLPSLSPLLLPLADALILMPKFGPSIKSLLTNKDKLFELAKTPLNEHCSTVLLKWLLEKLRDPDKFLIPFVDFDVDPRVPLILERSYLKTGRDLIDVYARELTLQEYSQEVLGFFDVIASGNPTPYYDPIVSTSSLPLTPFKDSDFLLEEVDAFLALEDDATSPKVDHSYYDPKGDILLLEAFLNDDPSLPPPNQGKSRNPTPYYNPIVSTSSLTLTPFEDSDFLLEEVDAFLALEDDPTLPVVDQSYFDLEGDILLLEAFLNDDPSLPPPNQGKYLPQVRKELKNCKAKNDKSSIDDPFEVEFKDLPPHLEYAFLEGDNKFPVIIAKDLSVEEKAALIKAATLVVSRKDAANFYQSWTIILTMGFLLKTATSVVMLKYGATHRLATAYHPQTSRQTVSDHHNELNELRDQAYETSLIYKEKTKRIHDSKIKDRVFNVDDRVLLFNSRPNILSGKLKTRWSGPFTITHLFPYGTVELSQTDGPNFKMNGHILKHYFEEDIPKMVVPNL
nr:reverse transcriptase domain-containing protein [Tanacetum cinerariifolium]